MQGEACHLRWNMQDTWKMEGGKWNLHALISLKNPNPKKILDFAKHMSLPGFLFAFAFVFVSTTWK